MAVDVPVFFRSISEGHNSIDGLLPFVQVLDDPVDGEADQRHDQRNGFCVTAAMLSRPRHLLIGSVLRRHVRALGFLYLRYVCKPAHLWDWFGPYLDDEERVQLQGGVRARST